MSIKNATVQKDPATVTYGTGTSTTLKTLGDSLNQHSTYLAVTGEDLPLQQRVELVASIKQPKVQESAPNGYTQARNILLLKTPLVLDNGGSTVMTARVEIAVDVEATSAEKSTIRHYLAQLLTESSFEEFWNSQSID